MDRPPRSWSKVFRDKVGERIRAAGIVNCNSVLNNNHIYWADEYEYIGAIKFELISRHQPERVLNQGVTLVSKSKPTEENN